MGKKGYRKELHIAKNHVYELLSELYEEIKSSEFYIEGDATTEPFYIYHARITCLVSLLSVFSLWIRYEGKNLDGAEEIDEFCREFCLKNRDYMFLWGEAAVPQYLSFYWYYNKIDATLAPSYFLLSIIGQIISFNNPRKFSQQNDIFPKTKYCVQDDGLANVYYDFESLLPYMLQINDNPMDDCFLGHSHTLWALIAIYVRLNFRGPVSAFWKDATYISEVEFQPQYKWHFFRWRNEKGQELVRGPKHRQQWSELRRDSQEIDNDNIPEKFREEPILLVLFLCVFPHRISTSIVKWLDSEMLKID